MGATRTNGKTATASPAGEGSFRIFTQTNTNDIVDPAWLNIAAEEGLIANEVFMWLHGADGETLDSARFLDVVSEQGAVISSARYRRSGKVEVLVRLDGALANVQLSPPSRIWAAASARTQEEASAVLDRIVALFPESTEDDDTPTIPLTVWASGSEPTRRTREVEPWDTISANYNSRTRDDLGRLMDPGYEAGKGGRLILLHGAPGTGKSTALATLAWQWKSFAELHYVIDPAAFLSEPEYLLNVSFGRRSDEHWRVVLLEDAGGLFSPDAKQNAGEDRLGRLLNATDGMLGHSSKALFVITTNEPLSSFHSAVSRPGRCAAAVEFLPMSEEEARVWLEKRERTDLAAEVAGERTLAELYAMLGGERITVKPKAQVGFRAYKG